jgi:signal transduction histidine kinase
VDELELQSTYSGKQEEALQRELKQSAPAEEPAIEDAESGISSKLDIGKKQKARLRKEQSLAPAQLTLGRAAEDAGVPQAIELFDNEVGSFQISLLESGHFVLYRYVWREQQGERLIQGAVLDQKTLLQGLVEEAFRESPLANMSQLIVAFQGNILQVFAPTGSQPFYGDTSSRYGGGSLKGERLFNMQLSSPFDPFQLVFSIDHLPSGQGAAVVRWSALVLMLVLMTGAFLVYRLGLRQMQLANQQQDFVSAVSHELKTPLTSIRMYGEILKQGWATEEQKQQYYDYIFNESERLSRLISNVLQMARMSRNDLALDIRPHTVNELMDLTRSSIGAFVDAAGYSLSLECPAELEKAIVDVDGDGFCQVVINLVDNAIKFSGNAEQRKIDISVHGGTSAGKGAELFFSIRDYGEGIDKDQMKKIFQLFYRSENELTRETTGTGIGLALVSQLVTAMNGRVDVVNASPGAEFRVILACEHQPDNGEAI